MLLHFPFMIHSLCVQSSAYLCVLTSSSSGTHASKSSIWILNKVGESTKPCSTPAGQNAIDDNDWFNLTCWVLPDKKLFTHSQKFLLTFMCASLLSKIPWSTRSKAFLKSIKRAWMPAVSRPALSVALNHGCVIAIRADVVERSLVKPCWLGRSVISFWLSCNCTLSKIFPICGRTETYLTSLLMSTGGYTLDTGETRPCL